ncbi:MAG: HlyD family type I secretion periplasmic adaptor subunit [Magnetococcales bacterium]|nr:HlyD family type I secretion periplasmic adaptor subunit [Magnetococcales bacterium]
MQLFPAVPIPHRIRPLEIMGNDREVASPALIRATWKLVALAFLPLFVWAALSPLQDVAHVPGQVLPGGAVQSIQHLEGGVVAEVLVKENQFVRKQDILFRMDDTQFQAELEQLDARVAGLQARAIRAKAIGNGGGDPDFSVIPERYRHLVEGQTRVFADHRRALEQSRSVIQAQIDQREVELHSLKNALATARKQVTLTASMREIRQDLLDKKALSRIVYLETLKANETAQGEVKRLLKQMENIGGAITEAKSRLEQLTSEAMRQANDELSSVTNEMAQLREQRVALEDRVRRVVIVAPASGIVQDVNIGAKVIPAGGSLARIISLEDPLQVEIHISPRDVGRIREGSDVVIKFSSYPFIFYGRMFGTLLSISPSTLLDEKQSPYYKGVVRLDRNHMGDHAGEQPILPGMLAQVDIALDERKVHEILWQPVSDTLRDAFKEH